MSYSPYGKYGKRIWRSFKDYRLAFITFAKQFGNRGNSPIKDWHIQNIGKENYEKWMSERNAERKKRRPLNKEKKKIAEEKKKTRMKRKALLIQSRRGRRVSNAIRPKKKPPR